MASVGKGTNRIVSLSLPADTLADMDSVVKEAGYPSRSELVRDAVRALLRNRAEMAGQSGHIDGVMVLVYEHEYAAQVSEARHAFMSIFKAFMHADFDGGEDCCEVLMFCGDAARVKEAHDALSALVGVKEARIFLA